MDTTKEIRASSKDGSYMVVYRQHLQPSEPYATRKESAHVTIIDRQLGKPNYKLDLNTKEEIARFIELHEMLEAVVKELRGW